MCRCRVGGCYTHTYMVVPLLASVLLGGLWIAALGWVWVPPLALIATGVAGTLLGVTAQRGLASLVGVGVAIGAWALLLAGTLQADPDQPVPKAGLARIVVEPLRTACGVEGCWAEAQLIRCSPIDEETCSPSGSLLSLSTDQELPLGARVSLVAKLSPRLEFRNPALASRWPDTRPPLRARAAGAVPPRIDDVGWLSRVLHSLRGVIRERFDSTLGPPHAGIARALLLGEASAVASELNDAIRNAGVSHVLAVSGMHVTVLVGGLAALMRALWLRSRLALLFEARRAAAVQGALLAPLVASLCGGSPSAVRAAITSTLMFALVALGRRPSALAVSALAVGIHIAIEPRDALHPGFVLSVVATAALLTASNGPEAGLLKALRESVRAWVSTAPFLVLCFGGTSLVAILANVILLPLGGLLIPIAVAQLTAALLGVDAWLGTRGLFSAASGAFVGASRLCAALDPGIKLPAPSPVQLLALCALAGVWLLAESWRVRLGATVSTALVLLLSEWLVGAPLAPGELQVLFLDVGQGDAALVQTGDGTTMLLDAGGSVNGGPDPGAGSVLPVLSALRVTRLNVVVMSHPHPDHYGGLEAVLNSVAVDELWDTGQAEAEGGAGAQRIVELARARGAKIRRPAELCGREHALGNAALSVVAPCPGFDEAFGPNDNSFVVRMQHGQRSFLFTGDVEEAAERELVARYGRALDSDVLKIPHHGSRTSSSEGLLKLVTPWVALVSAGRANRFGHPHQDVVQRLGRLARNTLRIDQVGGVRVLSDGKELTVSAWDPAVSLRLGSAVER